MSNQKWGTLLRACVLIVAMACVGVPTRAAAAPGDRAMYFEGRGQALVYPFWTVENSDTLLEIVNSLTGFRSTGQKARWVLVAFHIRDTASRDLLDFSVCLSPGDVWTAALFQDGAATKLKSTDRSGFGGLSTGPPSVLTLGGAASRGYIEAVMVDNGLTQRTGCNGSHDDPDFSAGSDADGIDQPLFGRIIYVNTATGLAGGFNAEAIKDLDASVELLSGTLHGSIKAFQALALGHDDDSVVAVLLGRWLVDPAMGADTQLVITFPLGGQSFNLCSGEGAAPFGTFINPCTTTTRLDFSLPAQATLWIRNDEEGVNNSPRKVPLGNEVNVITFSDFPDLLQVGSSGNAGWFRLMIDEDEDEVTDSVPGQVQPAGPATTVRLPHVLPVVGFTIISAPIPAGKLHALFPFQTEQPASPFDCKTGIGFSCD